MEQAITTYLVFHAISVVFYKYKAPYWLMSFANNKGSRFLYQLAECEFCLEHHLSIPVVVASGFYFGFDWVMIVWPLCMAALSNIIKSLSNETPKN